MMTEISRRTVLAGAAATAAAAAIGTVSASSPAAAAEAPKADPMDLFTGLSAALTGIDAKKLAPDVDPLDVKSAYFKRAREARPTAFVQMLQIFEKNKADPMVGDIILNRSGPEIRYLARSIMLAWYLGAWYDPAVLARYNSARSPDAPVPFEIISPDAYTQGWVWRVAQAHPMGYSNLQFGYWSMDPPPLDAFIKSA
ncbi:MAG: sugar dehydrogenase complex small subunit [Alphaproteobacteria bacterium]